MSSGDFESTFIKAGDNKTKEGLRAEEAIRERVGPRECSVIGKNESR